ncbi:hypothetical protein Tco_0446063, partial [Tanacetum coccineum]
VLTASFILFASYASTMSGIEETVSTNWFEMKRVGGGGRVIADKRGGSARVVTRTSTSDVASVLTLKIKSIAESRLGLSMFETKPDDTEELCC